MEEIFKRHHPEEEVAIPGFRCERGARADGLSYLRIFKSVWIKDGFKYPEKHVVTVYSDGTVTT